MRGPYRFGMYTGMKLRDYLAASGISISAFARMIGVSAAAVGRYVAGHRVPRPKHMRQIMDVTNGAVRPEDFLPNFGREPLQ